MVPPVEDEQPPLSAHWRWRVVASARSVARAQRARIRLVSTVSGRVNSARRICLCAAADVDSLDESGVSRFAEALPPLDLARRKAEVESCLSRDEIASLAARSSMPERGRA